MALSRLVQFTLYLYHGYTHTFERIHSLTHFFPQLYVLYCLPPITNPQTEMQAIVNDNANYSKVVLAAGFRTNFKSTDFSAIFDDESTEKSLKEAAEVSMGTEIADMDIINIQALAEQVLSMTEYRIQLFEYLKNRMNAIAPNLTILVGELVGARLISHAGSLMNLAKQPASTVQILGAEKALFRALKTKHDTPKYGLIYNASIVG